MEKIAFLFPGQGAQYVGMGKDLYEAFAESKVVFKQADEALGFSLSRLCFNGPQQELSQTVNCQPAILTVSIACLAAFKVSCAEKFPSASFMAGLSLGEYSTLVAAEALDFPDAIKLVRKRAELMQEAAQKKPGKMAAIIGLDRQPLKEILDSLDSVGIANLNCPGQIVISGAKEAVDKAKELALEKGAKKTVDLQVSGAFHSSFMREAAAKFKDLIKNINVQDAKTPIVSNVDAVAASSALKIKENLEKQIYSAVLWEDSIRFMLANGASEFYEIGPGKVLKGLMRRISESAEVKNIEKKADLPP